jgi:hypothetical protein
MIAGVEAYGSRSKANLQKTLHRQVLAWEQDFRVPFVFCDSRRLAEMTTLAILQRHYRHATKKLVDKDRDLELEAAVAAL